MRNFTIIIDFNINLIDIASLYMYEKKHWSLIGNFSEELTFCEWNCSSFVNAISSWPSSNTQLHIPFSFPSSLRYYSRCLRRLQCTSNAHTMKNELLLNRPFRMKRKSKVGENLPSGKLFNAGQNEGVTTDRHSGSSFNNKVAWKCMLTLILMRHSEFFSNYAWWLVYYTPPKTSFFAT